MFVNQNDLNIYTDDSNTYAASETIAAYVKQSSLYYNRANSVITATSDTVIEPSSNDTISLGTSTNKFSNIYATTFNGDLNGNASSATTATNADHATSANSATTADSATKATQDGNGNTISSYYCTLSTEQTISGKKIFNGGNIDFVLGDNNRNISFRYSPDYDSWTSITCYNSISSNYITLHFTNNNTDVIQLTHTCTSESVNNIQKVKSLVTKPSVDNVWQLGASDKRLNKLYISDIGDSASPVKTMYISGGNPSYYIAIDNSGKNSYPTIAPSTTGNCCLGTSSKHWFDAYINNLYIGRNGNPLITFIINSLSGTNSTATAIGSIRVIKISVTNKDSDIAIFSAGSNVSGYTIYQGSIANGTFNYKSSALTGTWKLLSELMTPSGIGGDTYTGSLYAIAIRVA